jgi:hypothetical protein
MISKRNPEVQTNLTFFSPIHGSGAKSFSLQILKADTYTNSFSGHKASMIKSLYLEVSLNHTILS